jgi:hypothetical protein
MQLGTEIGKMTRKLFTGFSKSRPWMLNTADRMAEHRKSDRRRDDLCAGGLRKRGCRKPRSIESITIRLPSEFLKLVRHSLLFQAASIFASQQS